MTKLIKRACFMTMAFVLCIGMAGCSSKLTPKKLMTSVEKNLAESKSVTNTLHSEVEMEGLVDLTRVTMDMTMENTVKPMAGHAQGITAVKMNDTNLASNIELYQVQEDGKDVTYSKMYDKWSRAEADDSQEALDGIDSGLTGNIFEEAGDSLEEFRIAKEAVEVNEKQCYEMYGDITGGELLKFLGMDMMGAFGLVELPDNDVIMKMKIPVTIDIYQKEKLPARIIVDMTDVMNDLYDQYKKATNVNDFTIELVYTDFDQVKEIQVPQAVKDAVE